MAVSTITYSDKSDINVNSNVPSTNKIQATDMNEIKSVVNNNSSELSKLQGYSTVETVIGTWIDGEPIYRKVINFTNTSTNWETIDTIANMDEVVTLKGYTYDSGNNKTVIPSYGTDSVQIYITSAGAVNKKATSYYQNKTGTLILEYTKTS